MTMTDFERSLARAMDELTPEPPHPVRAEQIVDDRAVHPLGPRRATHRQWLAAGLAACVVALVAVVVAVTAGSGPSAHRRPVAGAPSYPPASVSTSASGSSVIADCGADVPARLTIRDAPIAVEITLRNAGGRACRLTGAPAVHFVGTGFDLATTFRPGRAALPATLPAGGRARFAVSLRTLVPRASTSGNWVVTVQVGTAAVQRLRPPLVSAHTFTPTGLVYLGP